MQKHGSDSRSISELLRDAGYSHCRTSGHGLYRHAVWRTDDGSVVGYMTAAEACLFLNCSDDMRTKLLPFVVGFGPDYAESRHV